MNETFPPSKKGHEVVEARLRLLIEMIQSDCGPPAEVAEEARRLFNDGIGGGIAVSLDTLLTLDDSHSDSKDSSLGEMREGSLRLLHGTVSKFKPVWNEYTKDSSWFEQDLLERMEHFFKIVGAATQAVRHRALDALQDPKNWPFDADFSQDHPTNVEAAKAHRVTYSPELRQYVDDGCPRFDAYGQPL